MAAHLPRYVTLSAFPPVVLLFHSPKGSIFCPHTRQMIEVARWYYITMKRLSASTVAFHFVNLEGQFSWLIWSFRYGDSLYWCKLRHTIVLDERVSSWEHLPIDKFSEMPSFGFALANASSTELCTALFFPTSPFCPVSTQPSSWIPLRHWSHEKKCQFFINWVVMDVFSSFKSSIVSLLSVWRSSMDHHKSTRFLFMSPLLWLSVVFSLQTLGCCSFCC